MLCFSLQIPVTGYKKLKELREGTYKNPNPTAIPVTLRNPKYKKKKKKNGNKSDSEEEEEEYMEMVLLRVQTFVVKIGKNSRLENVKNIIYGNDENDPLTQFSKNRKRNRKIGDRLNPILRLPYYGEKESEIYGVDSIEFEKKIREASGSERCIFIWSMMKSFEGTSGIKTFDEIFPFIEQRQVVYTESQSQSHLKHNNSYESQDIFSLSTQDDEYDNTSPSVSVSLRSEDTPEEEEEEEEEEEYSMPTSRSINNTKDGITCRQKVRKPKQKRRRVIPLQIIPLLLCKLPRRMLIHNTPAIVCSDFYDDFQTKYDMGMNSFIKSLIRLQVDIMTQNMLYVCEITNMAILKIKRTYTKPNSIKKIEYSKTRKTKPLIDEDSLKIKNNNDDSVHSNTTENNDLKKEKKVRRKNKSKKDESDIDTVSIEKKEEEEEEEYTNVKKKYKTRKLENKKKRKLNSLKSSSVEEEIEEIQPLIKRRKKNVM